MVSIYLIGYGRMGKKIHELSENLDVEICGTNSGESNFQDDPALSNADVIIEFTQPQSALQNILSALDLGIPIVSGTTGWLESWDEVINACKESSGRFFYASNFSFGANVMFYMNQKLAEIMSTVDGYDVHMKEIHHTKKLDKPSGTAATLANDIIDKFDGLSNFKVDEANEGELKIICEREGDVKGFHEVIYTSPIDELRISHNALSRDGFALGAIKAAQWLIEQEYGVYGMEDMMGLK